MRKYRNYISYFKNELTSNYYLEFLERYSIQFALLTLGYFCASGYKSSKKNYYKFKYLGKIKFQLCTSRKEVSLHPRLLTTRTFLFTLKY